MSASALFDMEADLLGSVEMADAVYSLLEAGSTHGLDVKEVAALLRCVVHLQDHAGAALRLWNDAIQNGQVRAVAA